jgi:hypothetical protein
MEQHLWGILFIPHYDLRVVSIQAAFVELVREVLG